MPNERIICCCGASSWSKVIAWFQIVIHILLIILYISSLVGLTSYDPNDIIPNKDSFIAAVSISLVISILGFIMGIILLKGANQKRVGYLRGWLIYAGAAILTSIVSLIISLVSTVDSYSIGSTLGSGIIGIAINAFCFAVVYIHMKEINEGVFVITKGEAI